jgi:hypothetical protein
MLAGLAAGLRGGCRTEAQGIERSRGCWWLGGSVGWPLEQRRVVAALGGVRRWSGACGACSWALLARRRPGDFLVWRPGARQWGVSGGSARPGRAMRIEGVRGARAERLGGLAVQGRARFQLAGLEAELMGGSWARS